MGCSHQLCALPLELLNHGDCKSSALHRVRAGAQLIQQHQTLGIGGFQDFNHMIGVG